MRSVRVMQTLWTLCLALVLLALCPSALCSTPTPPAPPSAPLVAAPPFKLPEWKPPPIQFTTIGGAAPAQIKCKHEGQEWKRCRAPCPVTCTNMRPTAKDECNRLDCQDEGFCQCPGDRPVWDEAKKRCASLSDCSNVPVERVVSPRKAKAFVNKTESSSQSTGPEAPAANAESTESPSESESTTVECPELMCNVKNIPWRCPPGSKVDNPKDRNGCLGCKTCVDDALRPVKVPYCWTVHSVCPPSRCPPDHLPRLMFRANADGDKPCCHDFECFPKSDNNPSHPRSVTSIGNLAVHAKQIPEAPRPRQPPPPSTENKPAVKVEAVPVPLSERSLGEGLSTTVRRDAPPTESTGLYSGAARMIHRLQARTLELADPLLKLREKELYLLTGSTRGVASPRHWGDEEL